MSKYVQTSECGVIRTVEQHRLMYNIIIICLQFSDSGDRGAVDGTP